MDSVRGRNHVLFETVPFTNSLSQGAGPLMSRTLTYLPVWILSLGLMAGACSSAETTQPESGPSSAPVVDEPVVEDTEADRRPVGPPADVVSQLIQKALQTGGSVSYRTLVQRLGVPQRVETEPIANQYVRGQIDTLRTLVYPGMEALVYDVTSEAKTFLVRLSLSGDQYATPEGLRVGLTEERVIDKLGPPTRRNSATGELIYQETEATPTSMVVRLQEGRVVQIDWEFYFA